MRTRKAKSEVRTPIILTGYADSLEIITEPPDNLNDRFPGLELKHFFPEDLQNILKEVNAPALPATNFQAKSIVLTVDFMISNKSLLEPAKNIAYYQFWSAMETIKKVLPGLIENRRINTERLLKQYEGRPNIVTTGLEAQTKKLEELNKIVDDVTGTFWHPKKKARGSHSAPSVKDPVAVTDIYLRLGWGWKTENINPLPTQKMRYEIVQRCLEKAGMTVNIPAIRQAITKQFKDHPRLLKL